MLVTLLQALIFCYFVLCYLEFPIVPNSLHFRSSLNYKEQLLILLNKNRFFYGKIDWEPTAHVLSMSVNIGWQANILSQITCKSTLKSTNKHLFLELKLNFCFSLKILIFRQRMLKLPDRLMLKRWIIPSHFNWINIFTKWVFVLMNMTITNRSNKGLVSQGDAFSMGFNMLLSPWKALRG